MANASLHNSDLDGPWARRRAVVWIAVCLALAVGLVSVAVARGDWLPWLMAFAFAAQGFHTTRRLARHRSINRARTGRG